MNVNQRILLVSLLVVTVAASGSLSGAQDHNAAPPKPFVVGGTHQLTLHSAIVGDDYDLYVSFPKHYQNTTKSFPVVYLIDGQYDFGLVSSSYYDQYYDGMVTDLIVVGITWSGEHRNVDSLRMRDYTPSTMKMVPQSGNASKFLAFIKNELVPYIEARYRTDRHDRTLMGSSLGGLFTLYAMFHETDLFTRYVLTSPSLQWDSGVMNTYEEAYHSKRTDLPVRLFMAIGELEGIDDMFQKFVDRPKSRNCGGLHLQAVVLAGMGHAGGKPGCYSCRFRVGWCSRLPLNRRTTFGCGAFISS